MTMVLQQSVENPTILFMDEPCFSRTGIAGIHKEHVSSCEIPHAIRSHRHQRQLSTYLWDSILSDCLMDPHILQARVSGNDYFIFLKHLSGQLPLICPSATERCRQILGTNSTQKMSISNVSETFNL